ncbi:hypothetical protein NLU13_4802 [Sarocladium strictum]|uniref:Peroxidase n=1 Tax=Sarocladium strictum TaxID=5046 RepID=A0AA39GKC9_SARSR|nr:hypothetical protein NLU13_4802 [Sarocladium strictum]
MKYLTAAASVALAAPLVAASQLVWPSKWDELEDLMTMQSGYDTRGFSDAVVTCSFGNNEQGRQNTAEWIRTGFHDMITHNAAAGTGGLDASIFWELDRAENPGAAFTNTFSFFSGFYNTRASASDLVALGVSVATGACGGPKVPFRAGRIDAGKAGPPGVPEPHTNLEKTLDAFVTAGFDNKDMVAMVACGHAIGGVHSVDFPDITGIHAEVGNDTTLPFQNDVSTFHNGVVTEFLNGKTKNPLVVAKNDTLNSDKRIFNSDRATMKKLATRTNFNSMCGDIFARMVDTVPKSVQLTDVIDPYDVKPYISELSLDSKGDLHFSGFIRMRATHGTGRNQDDLAVTLLYADRNGKGQVEVPTKRAQLQSGLTGGLNGELFVSFEFDTTIKGATGISKFLVKEITPSTKATRIHDNQKTGGYKVNDKVLYQLSTSCNQVGNSASSTITINAMVRSDCAGDNPLTLKLTQKKARKGTDVPALVVQSTAFKKTGKAPKGWVAYQVKANTDDQFARFDIALGGKNPTAVEFQSVGALPETCAKQ